MNACEISTLMDKIKGLLDKRDLISPQNTNETLENNASEVIEIQEEINVTDEGEGANDSPLPSSIKMLFSEELTQLKLAITNNVIAKIKKFFNSLIIDTLIINRRDGKIIRTSQEFDEGVAKLKQILLAKSKCNGENENAIYFNHYLGANHQIPSNAWDEFKIKASLFLSDIKNPDTLSLNRFERYASLYCLNNFDSLLEEFCSGQIQVDAKDKGELNRKSYAKKIESQKNEMFWNMSDHEYSDSNKYVSNVAKKVITSVPIGIPSYKDGKFTLIPTGDYLTAGHLGQFQHVLSQAVEYDIYKNGIQSAGKYVLSQDPLNNIKFYLKLALDYTIAQKKGAKKSELNQICTNPVIKDNLQFLLPLAYFMYYTGEDSQGAITSLHDLCKNPVGTKAVELLDVLNPEAAVLWEISKTTTPVYMQYAEDYTLIPNSNSEEKHGLIQQVLKFKGDFDLLTNITKLIQIYSNLKDLAEEEREQNIDETQIKHYERWVPEGLAISTLNADDFQKITNSDTFKYFTELVTGLSMIESAEGILVEQDIKNLIGLHDLLFNLISNNEEGLTELLIRSKITRDTNYYIPLKSKISILTQRAPVTIFKDINGNNIPNTRLASLAAGDVVSAYIHALDVQKNLGEGVNADKINLFTEQFNLLTNIKGETQTNFGTTLNVNEDYIGNTGIKLTTGSQHNNKDARQLSVLEQLYDSFIGDYLSLKNKGMAAILFAAFSDKDTIWTKIINLQAQLKTPVKTTNNRIYNSLFEMLDSNKGQDGIEALYKLDYKYRSKLTLYTVMNVLDTWHLILNHDSIKKELNEDDLLNLNTIDFNKIKQEVSKYINADEVADIDLDSLLIPNIQIAANRIHTILGHLGKKVVNCKTIASELGLELVEELHFTTLKRKGEKRIGLNPLLIMAKFENKYDPMTCDVNNNTNIINNFYESSFGLIAGGFKKFAEKQISHFNAFKESQLQNILDLLLSSPQFKIDPDAQSKFPESLKTLFSKKGEDLQNSIISEMQRYLALTNLVMHQYLNMTVKEAYLDPAKQEHIDLKKRWEECVNATSKRNVTFGATIERFMSNLFNGVSRETNVAIVDSFLEEVYNSYGSTHNLDIFDGLGFISPYQSRMEDASLVGAGRMLVKKTFGTCNNSIRSSCFKWASNEITNFHLLQQGSKFNMEAIFKKMHDLKWDESIDITTGIKANKLKKYINNVLLQSPIYILHNDLLYYKISSIRKEKNSPYTYIITSTRENKEGETIEITSTHTIDSIYTLWKALGGAFSYVESALKGKYELGENIHDVIYKIICNTGAIKKKKNNTGEIKEENNIGYTLNDLIQPLRDKFIGILADKSAVKRGQVNVNPSDAWINDAPLNTFKINMDFFGRQLDSRHGVDESEITELSQTLAALAELGNSFDLAEAAYKMIGEVISEALENSKAALGTIGLLMNFEAIASNLSNTLKEAYNNNPNGNSITYGAYIQAAIDANNVLSFSNPLLGKEAVKVLISELNKSIIKRKYSGIGTVICGSSNIFLLYRIGKDNFTYPQLVERGRRVLSVVYNINPTVQEYINILTGLLRNTIPEILFKFGFYHALGKIKTRTIIYNMLHDKSPLSIKDRLSKYINPKVNSRFVGLTELATYNDDNVRITDSRRNPGALNTVYVITDKVGEKERYQVKNFKTFTLETQKAWDEYNELLRNYPNARVFVDNWIPTDLKPLEIIITDANGVQLSNFNQTFSLIYRLIEKASKAELPSIKEGEVNTASLESQGSTINNEQC